MTTVFCRATYVEGFFVTIFDLMTFFSAFFFVVNLCSVLFEFTNGIIRLEIHISWESLTNVHRLD